jgi:hypothetical protein
MIGLDIRSLAVFRIVLGLVVLMDLAGRFQYARVHYSDAGVLPRERLLDLVTGWRWSLMLMNGSEGFAYLVLITTAVVALAVIAGFHTKLAVFALWLLVISIQVRNPYLQNGGDTYLRLMLFWAMFLPLGSAWSLDRRLATSSRPAGTWIASMGSAALLLQMASMYWFTAMLKSGPEWRSDFSALWYSLGAGHLATPLGLWAHQFREPLAVLTVVTLLVEWVAPILLFIPFWNGRLRIVAALSIMGLQAGILVTLQVGLFPWISALSMVAVLPSVFWDAACRQVARWSWPHVSSWRRVPQVARQSVSAIIPRESWSVAFSAATKPQLFFARPDLISGTEPRASVPDARTAINGTEERDDCRPLGASLAGNLLVTVFLLLALGWNITTVSAFTLSPEARQVTIGLGLHQEWNMFAPRPPRVTQWFLLVGTTEGRQRVNLVPSLSTGDFSRAAPLTWETPDNIGSDYYGDKFWRKYLAAIGKGSKQTDQRLLAAYACRTWNSDLANRPLLHSVQLVSASQPTLPDGERGEPVIRQLERFDCV